MHPDLSPELHSQLIRQQYAERIAAAEHARLAATVRRAARDQRRHPLRQRYADRLLVLARRLSAEQAHQPAATGTTEPDPTPATTERGTAEWAQHTQPVRIPAQSGGSDATALHRASTR